MIEYDPHRWLDHLLDVQGLLSREITARALHRSEADAHVVETDDVVNIRID